MGAAARNAGPGPSFGRASVRGLTVARRERETMPCHFLCMECGQLVAQRESGGYRASPDDERPASCRQCGAQAWADLREEAVVEQLKLCDDALPNHRHPLGRALSAAAIGLAILMVGAACLGGLTLFVICFRYGLGGELLSLNIGGAAGFGAFTFIMGSYALIGYLIPALRRRMVADRHFPLRWSTTASLAPNGAAPLTGRSCVGYEVAIRKSEDPRAPAGTWLLVERRGEIGKEIARERVEVDPTRPDVATYLRRHGIDPVGLPLVVYETVV